MCVYERERERVRVRVRVRVMTNEQVNYGLELNGPVH